MGQTSYSQATPRGVAGGIYDIAPYIMNSRNAEGTGVVHGLGVVVGTSKGVQVKKPVAASTALVFEGIVAHSYAHEMDSAGAVTYAAGETVNVMKEGNIWALLADGTTPAYGDPLLLVVDGAQAGKFTNAAGKTAKSYTTITVNGMFIGTAGSSAVAPVHINADIGVAALIAEATAD